MFRGQSASDSTTMATMPWESLFADTVLKALIHEGLYQNLNLKIAIQKIEEARATFGQSKAAFLPSLSGNASVTQSKQSVASLDYPPGTVVNTKFTSYQLGLSTSWEADGLGTIKQRQKICLMPTYYKLMQLNAPCKPN